ncbi:hypothetical protein M1P56_24615 [Streptomyces sp. HU2014]|uniref:hypothetical protein n=1 Tax=Streptomyces sp. HU2014 TaxID=2939414 RepID=UPI00200BDFFC|nr:hypothetical protein [Streptomyces sp. HU2014]UQI47302.1 hypothetical protein M1P56_24615 [Streptomyces sp. HU2014]
MRQPPPPNVTMGPLAPHIPADLYRQAERDGRPFVIVQAPPAPAAGPRYARPLFIGLAVAFGLMGMTAAALALFQLAAHTAAVIASTAGPIGLGGISLKLARSKG